MFPKDYTTQALNDFCQGCMVSHIGVVFTEITEDSITAKMPVDERTKQPLGLLHGGANAVLAETIGSLASNILLDPAKQYAVGLEINANHIKSAKSGFVTGTCRPIHVGKGTHVWDIRITNEENELISISRLTMAILNRKD